MTNGVISVEKTSMRLATNVVIFGQKDWHAINSVIFGRDRHVIMGVI